MDKHFALEVLVPTLRSGQWKQTKGCLHNDKGFCCLGVICDLKGAKWEGEAPYHISSGDAKEWVVIPKEIMEAVGMKSRNGRFKRKKEILWKHPEGKELPPSTLSSLNDDGYSFLEIADFIEKYYEEL